MAKFHLENLAQLARQMEFTPSDTRLNQMAAAEQLLHIIDPAKAYPFDFIVFRITGYHPKTPTTGLLTGLALQHDLGLLIEKVGDTLDLRTQDTSEPVLTIEDVCEKFNVTSKTIQRWRRRGLPARRYIFPDSKRRVGFLLGSVERFLSTRRDQVCGAGNFSQINDDETAAILRHARRMARNCCEDEIARRIARMLNRSALTILHVVKKHDEENPADAIFANAPALLDESERTAVAKAYRKGASIAELAERLGRPRSAIYRALINDRVARLSRKKMRFIDDNLYHDDDASDMIESMVSQQPLLEAPKREELRIPRDLPTYLQDLYRTPLLTVAQERALFLKFNFHKFQFITARRRLDPELASNRQLCAMEQHLRQVIETKNEIVRANLRLVVSVARKHLRPALSLLELISDGNITLMRAVEGFDIHKGCRFSTYATLALMKGFARSVPQMVALRRQSGMDQTTLAAVADARPNCPTLRVAEQDEISRLMSSLDDRERTILNAHFGLGEDQSPASYEQVGQRLGLSKERVRQIEQTAIAKLRALTSSITL